jgi:hypothetical protein
MLNLTHTAKEHIDNYLHKVKEYLRGYTAVDSSEIESNIMEHIENELQGTNEPISAEDVDTIISRLGSPQQWVPEEELSWWWKLVLRFKRGPEDWRLAYFSFIALVLGLLIPHGVFIILLPASFLLARAALSVTENSKTLGTQRWLIYPSLILVYAFECFFIFGWPILALCGVADGLGHWKNLYSWWLSVFQIPYESTKYFAIWAFIITGFTGLWWCMLGLFALLCPQIVKTFFRPFADGLDRRRVVIFIFIAAFFSVVGITMTMLYAFWE